MSTERRTRAWVEVDGAAFRRNLARVRETVGPEVGLIPMVKADAYGLGADRAVPLLENEDPWAYGVATVEEGEHIRGLAPARPVLVCSPVPPGSIRAAVEADLVLTLSDLASLAALRQAAERTGRAARFHVEVDTGMGRAGFDWREAKEWAPRVRELSDQGLRWEGIATHFHSADEPDDETALLQWRRLDDVVKSLGGAPPGLRVHAANSAGLFRSTEVHGHAVRTGIFLYGGRPGSDLPQPETVVQVRARVVRVKDAPPGSTQGYGATYRASGWERWATLAIGYGDGLPRALGNRGHALLRGRRVPIVGRISMDVSVVDITDLERDGGGEPVLPGEVSTLLGTDGEERIPPEEVAEHVGTISYEILTGLGPRLPRVWMEHGGG